MKVKNIKKIGIEDVYDIIDVEDNNNYIANNFIVHNSSSDWAKRENKELKKKLAQVRTKHLFYILCFPMKLDKVESNYLQSFVNYWIDLYDRGVGAIYIKDRNPLKDTWAKDYFKKLSSYNEFTSTHNVEDILKKHPNYWTMVRFPKPPRWLYERYLKVREKNIYDEDTVMQNVSKEDIQRAFLILALRDIMQNDTTLTMHRILMHIKNNYDMLLPKSCVQALVDDAKQLVDKVRENAENKI